jgi:hypothetical protein
MEAARRIEEAAHRMEERRRAGWRRRHTGWRRTAVGLQLLPPPSSVFSSLSFPPTLSIWHAAGRAARAQTLNPVRAPKACACRALPFPARAQTRFFVCVASAATDWTPRRRLGTPGDAISIQGVASETPKPKKRLDAYATPYNLGSDRITDPTRKVAQVVGMREGWTRRLLAQGRRRCKLMDEDAGTHR